MNTIASSRLVILRNEDPDDHMLWVNACKEFGDSVKYRVVDLTQNNWLEQIQSEPFDILLTKPGGLTSLFKQLYDERIYILEKVLGYTLYPSAEEIFIYENKRFLSTWLKANNIPQPATNVFYNKDEALAFLNITSYPFIAKVNIGASGSGVVTINTKHQGITYLNETFSGKGAPQRSGPNFAKSGLFLRGLKYILHPENIKRKILIYKTKRTNLQKGFIIFQEYIQHDFEWRVVRIGDSFFAHKKLKIDGKASGSTIKGYEVPPFQLFEFVKRITDEHKFYSMAVDIFEDTNRGYLVNEMQCMFGQSDPYQMLVNGKAGRYKSVNGNWYFEEGDYAKNACFNLRLEHALKMSSKS